MSSKITSVTLSNFNGRIIYKEVSHISYYINLYVDGVRSGQGSKSGSTRSISGSATDLKSASGSTLDVSNGLQKKKKGAGLTIDIPPDSEIFDRTPHPVKLFAFFLNIIHQ